MAQGTGSCEFQVHQLLLLLSRISLSAMWWDCLYNYTCLLYRQSHHIQLSEIQLNGTNFECSYLNDHISGLEWTFLKIPKPK